MKQRVVTVISTLLNPQLLIADEPTSALDVSTQRSLIELLRELLDRQLVGGIIFVTHDLPVLRAIADRIAIMYAGKIAEVAPTDEIINRAHHPYTGALLRSVLVPDPHPADQRDQGLSPGSRRPAVGLPVPPAVQPGHGRLCHHRAAGGGR
jgi:peptide/nickel transport system ATP-binding protein